MKKINQIDFQGSEIIITMNDGSIYKGIITCDNFNLFYLNIYYYPNSIIFPEIEKKYTFQQKILGYTSNSGRFPYCKTREDVLKLLKALQYYDEI